MRAAAARDKGLLLVALAALMVGESSVVFAEGRKVAVGPFSGRRGNRLRRAVLQTLRSAGYQVASWSATRKTLRSLGPKAGVAKLGLTAVITGRIRRAGRSWRALILVRGADGEVKVGAAWSARRTRELLRRWPVGRKRLLAFLGGASQPTTAEPEAQEGKAAAQPSPTPAPPPAPTAAPTSEAKAPEAQESSEPLFAEGRDNANADEEEEVSTTAAPERRRRRPAAIDVSVGLLLLSRRYRYNDDIYRALRSHTINTTSAIGGTAEWYPAAHFVGGWPTKIGATASFRHALSVAPVTYNGVDHRSGVSSMSIGLCGRHRLGRFTVKATVAYGLQRFTVEEGTDFAERRHDIPNVSFAFARLGAGVRARLWFGFFASVQLAYLAVLDAGELGEQRFFPRATAGGVEAAGRIGYAIIPSIEARVGFDVRHFGVAMNPEPGDANIVGGASDQYLAWTFGLAYRLRHKR